MAEPTETAPPTETAKPADEKSGLDPRRWVDEYDDDPDDYLELEAYRAQQAGAAKTAGADEQPAGSTVTPAPAAPPAHPKALLERARALGIDDPAGYSTADLRAEVQQALDFRRYEASRQPRQQPQPQPAPPAPKAEEPEDVLKALGIDKDEWEPKLVGALENLARRNLDLQKRLDGVDAAHRTATLGTAYDALDAFFAGLPAEDRARFGDGDRFTLAADGPEVGRRLALVRAAGIDLADPPHPRQVAKLLRDAHAQLYPPAPKPAEPPKDAGAYAGEPPAGGQALPPAPPPKPAEPESTRHAVKDPETGKFVSRKAAEDEERKRAWMAAASPAPTARRDGPAVGDDAARRYVAEFYRSRGQRSDE